MLPLMFGQSALLPSPPSCHLYTQTRPLISLHIYALYQKASRTFESAAWASYDMAFHRQATNRGSLDWDVVDAILYNEAFAGRAKTVPRCWYCLADTHPSQDCMHAPHPWGPGGSPSTAYTVKATGGASSTSPGRSDATVPKHRHLSTVQLPGWLALQVPPMPICTRVHQVQAPTPRRRVWCW